MNQILDRLWCGSYEDGQDVAFSGAEDNPAVTHIFNLSQRFYFSLKTTVTHMPIEDEVFLPPRVWDDLTRLVAKEMAAFHGRSTVLVHCRLGKSRAPSLCIAYLIRCGFSPEKALKLVRLQRPEADPHPETLRSVIEWAKGV